MCRIRYKKTGRMKFLSHLETMKAWERSLRRSGAELLFSSGYNPHVQMSFALPTAVGISALSGVMDLQLADGFDLERIRTLSLPEGLEVLSVKEVEQSSASLMSRVHSAEYLIEGDMAALREIDSEKALPFVRVTKRRRKQDRDAREYIVSYTLEEDALRVRLLAGSEQSIRVSELLETLTGDPQAHFHYHISQCEIYDKEGNRLWEL